MGRTRKAIHSDAESRTAFMKKEDPWLVEKWISAGAYPSYVIPVDEIRRAKELLFATDISGSQIGRTRLVESAWVIQGSIFAVAFDSEDSLSKKAERIGLSETTQFYYKKSRFVLSRDSIVYEPIEIPWFFKSLGKSVYLRSHEFFVDGKRYCADQKTRVKILDTFDLEIPLKYCNPYLETTKYTLRDYIADTTIAPRKFRGKEGNC